MKAGSAGVPPAQHWHSLTPLLHPGSTGNGATIPLQPSPWGSRRQGGRAPLHGETERPPNAEDAGETPALPVGRLLPSFSLREEALPCRCGRAVPLRVSSVKRPILKKDEPRMNTNGHEYRWTCLAAMTSWDEGRERGRLARTTLAQPHPSPPPGSTGNGATIPLQPGLCGFRRQGGRVPHHGKTERPPNPEDAGETPALPEGGASSHPSCSARRHSPCRCGRAVPLRVSSVKHPIVNQDEPRMNTNGHEYRWTCLAATPSREEGRERGRPARTTLAQAYPSLPPGSSGNSATIPLQPSPWGSRRQGGRAPLHGETERPPNPENAGETPALPVGRLLPSFSLREEALPCRCGRAVPLRVSSVKHPIVNKDEPRMNTNGHEYGWTCWLRHRHGMKAGSASPVCLRRFRFFFGFRQALPPPGRAEGEPKRRFESIGEGALRRAGI